jgi:hypothetical protein
MLNPFKPFVNCRVDSVVVKAFLGHSTVKVTMRHEQTNMNNKRDAVRNKAPDCCNFAAIPPKSHPRLKIPAEKV